MRKQNKFYSSHDPQQTQLPHNTLANSLAATAVDSTAEHKKIKEEKCFSVFFFFLFFALPGKSKWKSFSDLTALLSSVKDGVAVSHLLPN